MRSLWNWLTDLKLACEACEGVGTVPCTCNENHEILCPNCNGTGAVAKQKEVVQKMEVPCDNPECHNGKVLCGNCHGTGKLSDGEDCPVCRGKGKLDCAICEGIGKIYRPHKEYWTVHETCHICGGTQYIPCPYCNGTDQRTCPECHGKGKRWNRKKLVFLGVAGIMCMIWPMVLIVPAGIAVAQLVWPYIKDGFAAIKENWDNR